MIVGLWRVDQLDRNLADARQGGVGEEVLVAVDGMWEVSGRG